MNKEQARLREIKTRVANTTDGTWVYDDGDGDSPGVFQNEDCGSICMMGDDGVNMLRETSCADAHFIANSKNDILFLLDLIESLQRERDNPQPLMYLEPSTGEIVRALRCVEEAIECKDCRYKYPVGNVILCDHEQMNGNAADRLEAQEREIEELKAEAIVNAFENAERIANLTTRAEQAERERDAAKADMKLIVDAVRDTHCDETCCFACKHDCDTSINDSGEYNSECPGFDRDDCFEWRGAREGEGK